jgi:hypothetical protein
MSEWASDILVSRLEYQTALFPLCSKTINLWQVGVAPLVQPDLLSDCIDSARPGQVTVVEGPGASETGDELALYRIRRNKGV